MRYPTHAGTKVILSFLKYWQPEKKWFPSHASLSLSTFEGNGTVFGRVGWHKIQISESWRADRAQILRRDGGASSYPRMARDVSRFFNLIEKRIFQEALFINRGVLKLSLVAAKLEVSSFSKERAPKHPLLLRGAEWSPAEGAPPPQRIASAHKQKRTAHKKFPFDLWRTPHKTSKGFFISFSTKSWAKISVYNARTHAHG